MLVIVRESFVFLLTLLFLLGCLLPHGFMPLVAGLPHRTFLRAPFLEVPALDRSAALQSFSLLPALVLYEWLRGPRRRAQLEAQEALFPREQAVPFGLEEAALAARLYSEVRRARGREIDLAIAAVALSQRARLWTLNPADLRDLPEVELSEPAG